MTEQTSKQEATSTKPKLAKFWLDEIDKAGKREREWRKEAKEVLGRYRNEKRKRRGFNILWANTELLKPAVLSRTPQPDVRRRFLQEDPVAHMAAQLLEKALKFTADDPRFAFTEALEGARDDMLLPGRGVTRVIYERDITRKKLHMKEEPDQVAEAGQPIVIDGFEMLAQGGEPLSFRQFFTTDDGTEVEPDDIDDDGNGVRDEITRQEVYCRHVYWEDYREGDARCWEDVPWLAYRHTLTRKQLKEQFGREKGMLVPLNAGGEQKRGEESTEEPESPLKRGIVWEIWDKEERKRVWIAEGFHDDVLDLEEDPLGLETFFPQPAPLYTVTSTATRIPVPEFRQYKDQADELDEVSMRITRLIKALKVRGAYAAVMKELADILNGDENELYPIENYHELVDIGGLEKGIMWLPIEVIARVLAGLYQQRGELKAEIFELTGLSDILRGATDARETLGAQQIKANFGNVRLTPRQQPMERHVREIFRIMAEVMAEHFTADHLLAMTGMQEDFQAPEQPAQQPQVPQQGMNGAGLQVPPQQAPQAPERPRVTMQEVMDLLRSDKTRAFSIDIETDSTIAPDAQKEQATVVEYLSAATNFVNAAAQAGQQSPQMVPLFLQMFKTASRRFKMGRELEESIDDTVADIMRAIEEAQRNPQPDPEMEKAKAELELDKQKAQAEEQRKNQEMQADLQRQMAEMQAKLALMEKEMEGRLAIRAQEAQADAEIEAFKAQSDAAIAEDRAVRDDTRKFIEAGITQ